VWACLPIGLNAALVTLEAGFVLNFNGLTRTFPKRDEPADAFPSTCGDVIAAGTMAGFTGLFLCLVSGIEQKNFPHHGLGKFFKLRGMASFADFVADVHRRRFFRGFFFRRPSRTGSAKQKHTDQRHEKKSSHDPPVWCTELMTGL
jgi:hypothetical protein